MNQKNQQEMHQNQQKPPTLLSFVVSSNSQAFHGLSGSDSSFTQLQMQQLLHLFFHFFS